MIPKLTKRAKRILAMEQAHNEPLSITIKQARFNAAQSAQSYEKTSYSHTIGFHHTGKQLWRMDSVQQASTDEYGGLPDVIRLTDPVHTKSHIPIEREFITLPTGYDLQGEPTHLTIHNDLTGKSHILDFAAACDLVRKDCRRANPHLRILS